MRVVAGRVLLCAVALALVVVGCAGRRPDAPGGSSQPPGAVPAEPATGQNGAPGRPYAGGQAPGWTGVDVNTGKTVSLRDFQDHVVLVNFFATWCEPCKVEMPDMQAVFARPGSKLKIVAIGADRAETREQLEAFARNLGLTFPVVFDGGRASDSYQILGIPTSFFVDRKGVVRTRYTGILSRELINQLALDTGKY